MSKVKHLKSGRNSFRHCKHCKEGRVVENKSKKLVFCSLCGHEFKK